MTGGTVVILGNVGRNFAAGMSGGIAYVYDINGVLNEQCNKEMVDLDPVDDQDLLLLTRLLEEHSSLTQSKIASFILSDLENQRSHFVKVFPKDYKKVLLSRTQTAASVLK